MISGRGSGQVYRRGPGRADRVVVLQRGTLVAGADSRGGGQSSLAVTSSGVGSGSAGGVTEVRWAASRSPGDIASFQRGRGAGSETLWVLAFTKGMGVWVVAVAYQRA